MPFHVVLWRGLSKKTAEGQRDSREDSDGQMERPLGVSLLVSDSFCEYGKNIF